MYKVCESCVVCASTQGQERQKKPPLKCIPVGEPFECLGMNFKEMDVSEDGNSGFPSGPRFLLSRTGLPQQCLSALLS